MHNRDFIGRTICNELNIIAYVVSSLNTVSEIASIHGTLPYATTALGRAINATALLSATLKPDSDQTISLKFSGSGPFREISVQADARGNIRGYIANPAVEGEATGMRSFSQLIGAGFLTVIKDIGLKDAYHSVMPIRSGDIALDVAYYLTSSQQIPSALILGLNLQEEGIASSGGILIQKLPETDDDTVTELDENIRTLPKSLGDALGNGENIYSFLSDILNNAPITILHESPLQPACRCNRAMLHEVLTGISTEELSDMIERDGGAEIICSFCKQKYLFSEEQLREIANRDEKNSP
jgi:molecular chaperone Hsp33